MRLLLRRRSTEYRRSTGSLRNPLSAQAIRRQGPRWRSGATVSRSSRRCRRKISSPSQGQEEGNSRTGIRRVRGRSRETRSKPKQARREPLSPQFSAPVAREECRPPKGSGRDKSVEPVDSFCAEQNEVKQQDYPRSEKKRVSLQIADLEEAQGEADAPGESSDPSHQTAVNHPSIEETRNIGEQILRPFDQAAVKLINIELVFEKRDIN